MANALPNIERTDDQLIIRLSADTTDDLIIELACYMYQARHWGKGKARAFTGLNFMRFQEELAKRNIDDHFTEQDLDKDLRNLGIHL